MLTSLSYISTIKRAKAQLRTSKAYKKLLPRFIISNSIENGGSVGTDIAIFNSNCSSHSLTVKQLLTLGYGQKSSYRQKSVMRW